MSRSRSGRLIRGSTGTDPSRVVGSGPFKFVEINEGEGTTTMVRNDDYWDKVPAVETVIFQVWPDDTAVTEALRAGELDMLMDPVHAGRCRRACRRRKT